MKIYSRNWSQKLAVIAIRNKIENTFRILYCRSYTLEGYGAVDS